MNIDRDKYEAAKAAILAVLREQPGLTHDELTSAVERRLEGRFEGSIPWYMESTKLDLEARRLIVRDSDGQRETYRLSRDPVSGTSGAPGRSPRSAGPATRG